MVGLHTRQWDGRSRTEKWSLVFAREKKEQYNYACPVHAIGLYLPAGDFLLVKGAFSVTKDWPLERNANNTTAALKSSFIASCLVTRSANSGPGEGKKGWSGQVVKRCAWECACKFLKHYYFVLFFSAADADNTGIRSLLFSQQFRQVAQTDHWQTLTYWLQLNRERID